MGLYPTPYQEKMHMLWLRERLAQVDQQMDRLPECYFCDVCQQREILKRKHLHSLAEYLELNAKYSNKNSCRPILKKLSDPGNS